MSRPEWREFVPCPTDIKDSIADKVHDLLRDVLPDLLRLSKALSDVNFRISVCGDMLRFSSKELLLYVDVSRDYQQVLKYLFICKSNIKSLQSVNTRYSISCEVRDDYLSRAGELLKDFDWVLSVIRKSVKGVTNACDDVRDIVMTFRKLRNYINILKPLPKPPTFSDWFRYTFTEEDTKVAIYSGLGYKDMSFEKDVGMDKRKYLLRFILGMDTPFTGLRLELPMSTSDSASITYKVGEEPENDKVEIYSCLKGRTPANVLTSLIKEGRKFIDEILKKEIICKATEKIGLIVLYP